jgi:heme/copper-type cytochrome/quinol oxidase subunit 2
MIAFWITLAVLVWLIVAVVLAFIFGGAVRLRDQRADTHGSRPHNVYSHPWAS